MFGTIKEFKTWLIDLAVYILKKSNMSDKTLGYTLRIGHSISPILSTLVIIFGPQIYALMTILGLYVAYIGFWIFSGCILHSIEYKLDNLDITLMDPLIELCRMEITPTTRLSVAQIVAPVYLISISILYYIRFGSIYLHNTIYSDLNIFKGFYQRAPSPLDTSTQISNQPPTIIPTTINNTNTHIQTSTL